MSALKKIQASILGVVIIFCGVFQHSAQAQSFSQLNLDASRLRWTDLTFHVKNFWVEVSTNIQFISLPAAEVEALLLPSPKGAPFKPATPKVYQMTINTIIDPKFRSPVNIYNRIWFNPSDASALGRISLRRGEDDYKKIYRFTDQGVFRHQLEPRGKNEAALDPEKWTNIKDSFYPYDLTQLGCGGATEASLLIYIICAAEISNMSNSSALCVFGKRQLHRIQLRKEGTLPLKINYIEKSRQVETRKEGTVNVQKITITAQPIETDSEEVENFSFLGLHKDITLYLEPHTGLLLQASGIIPTVGKADLKLQKAWVKE